MVRTEAEITIEYEDVDIAKAVAEAVSPDNCRVPIGLSVETMCTKEKVVAWIQCDSFPTFLATIDDLLFSVALVEKIFEDLKILK